MSEKINPKSIILSHFDSLKDDRNKKISLIDIITFYFAPVIVGIVFFISGQLMTNEVFNGSASVFGIFVGLLLNVQVAIFNIFLKKTEYGNDDAGNIILKKKISARNRILRELNANISYLILVCCFAICASIVFLSLSHNSPVFSAIIVALYVHIILNMMMTVKRGFALFDFEYGSGS